MRDSRLGQSCHPGMELLINFHFCEVIMGAMASQITSLASVYTTVYSGEDQQKHQSPVLLALCAGNSPVTGEFPAQRTSNADIFFHLMTSSCFRQDSQFAWSFHPEIELFIHCSCEFLDSHNSSIVKWNYFYIFHAKFHICPTFHPKIELFCSGVYLKAFRVGWIKMGNLILHTLLLTVKATQQDIHFEWSTHLNHKNWWTHLNTYFDYLNGSVRFPKKMSSMGFLLIFFHLSWLCFIDELAHVSL